MERVAVAAAHSEPVLLVGETGTGKTTLVQQIAKQVGGARWLQRGVGQRGAAVGGVRNIVEQGVDELCWQAQCMSFALQGTSRV